MKWPLVSRRAYDLAIEERDRLRVEVQVATDRLLSAWNEGKVIPPRPMEKPLAPEPLSPALLEYVQQFESEEGRQAAEESVRSYRTLGMSDLAILKQFETPR